MKRIKLPLPSVSPRLHRDGRYRPRYNPGPSARELGYSGQDLKHDDGTWFTLAEASAWALARQAELAGALKRRGRKATKPAIERTVADLLDGFFASEDFAKLRDNTRAGYQRHARAILYRPRPRTTPHDEAREAEPFASSPVETLEAADVKAFALAMARRRGLAMARSAIAVLASAWSWGRTADDWRLPDRSPCTNLRLAKLAPRVVTWSREEIAALVAAADKIGRPSIGDAVMLAAYTGQRQRDLLDLVDDGSMLTRLAAGKSLRFRQQKTGAFVAVFPSARLIERLTSSAERTAGKVARISRPVVACEYSGEAWGSWQFNRAFREARDVAAVTCKTIGEKRFQDLRDTALTWLAEAGASPHEIASMSGHSLQSVTQVLSHYIEPSETMARSAAAKVAAWEGEA